MLYLVLFNVLALFFSVEVVAVALLKHLVDVVWHSVLTLLIERQQVGVVVERREEMAVVRYAAALDAETLLSVLQCAHKPMVVRELLRMTPY